MAHAQFDPKAMVDFDSLWPRGLFPDDLTPTTDVFSGSASSGVNYSQSMPSNSASNFLYGTNVSNGSLSGMNNSVVGYKMRESSGNKVNNFSMRVIMSATHNQLVMNPVYLELLTKCVRLEAEAKIQSELRQEIVKSLVTRPPITEQGLGPFNIPDAIPASSSMTPNWVIIKLEPLKKEDYPLASFLWSRCHELTGPPPRHHTRSHIT
ncbi:hypothetical protein K435DRAFT_865725 [Dendrothele bispora CBS 962.96]|uniref:Uncharacterized protein n=1 Tax=Dendrothele bispora (strain CBS 962.96) TaxID=1314807 RepID=A0A4S8LIZ6_DENBC|nr:hypothetical protein K435DRAFT_865725 [Dendrothele bispora CBS 962.96]